MLKNHDIICMASANWDDHSWVNVQHLMWRFSRTNRVLYIDSIGLRKPDFKQKKESRRVLGHVFTKASLLGR